MALEREYSPKNCFQFVGHFGSYDALSVSVLLEVGKNACHLSAFILPLENSKKIQAVFFIV